MPNTQGNRKIKQHLEDLRKNEEFQKRTAVIRQMKSKAKRNVLLIKLCDDFGIDWELFQNIRENENDISLNWASAVDMCEVGFDFDETFSGIVIKSNLEKKIHKNAYPVSIDVHKFARKRDILDFVEKNWKTIEGCMKFFRDKPKIIRRRKNENRDDFIWENRDLSIKIQQDLIKKHFPGTIMGYEDIYKVISLERKRRNRKIA
jgi:hypothetical protein